MSPLKQPPFPSRAVAGGLIAMFLAFGVGRFAYTPLLPLMRQQAGLALDQAGYLASAMYLGYLSGSLVMTRLISRYGAFNILRGGALMLALTCTALAGGQNLWHWALLMFILGISSAAIFLAALSLVLGIFIAYGASWLTALLYSGIGVAIVLLGLVVPEIGRHLGWRGAWIFTSLTAFLGALGCLWLLNPAGQKRGITGSRPPAWPQPGARRAATFLLAAYFLHGFAYTIGATFMVSILSEFSGTATAAPFGWVLVGAMVIPSCIVWPLIAARLGETQTTAVLLALLALANILVVSWPSPLGTMIAAGLFGSSFLTIPGLVLGRLGQLAGGKKDQITGFATIIFGIAMVAGPSLGGFLTTRSGSFHTALIMAGSLLLVAAGLALLAENTLGRRTPVRNNLCFSGDGQKPD